MRAIFTKEALMNYASMIEKYGDIYLNEYGQVSLNKDSQEAKYLDEKRKVPARSCMYVHLHLNNFPKTVEALDAMFLTQTLQRAATERKDDDGGKKGRKPEVVPTDAGAFERLTNGKAKAEAEAKAKAEAEKAPVSHPDVIMPAESKPADGVKK